MTAYGTGEIADPGLLLPKEVVDELNLDDFAQRPPEGRRLQGYRPLVVAALCLGLVGTLMTRTSGGPSLATQLSESEPPVFGFVALNEYIKRDGPTGAEYPWVDTEVLEPYSVSTFEVQVDDASRGQKYVWEIAGNLYEGSSVTHKFTDTGRYVVKVTGLKSDGSETGFSSSRDVLVKYVRREVRDLTEQDRETFFNALLTLQKTKTEDGQKRYGAKYRDINYFTRLYLVATASQECDHFDSGLGSLGHHTAFVRLMEQSLQTIDPRISMPYWDYTEEAHTVWSRSGNVANGSTWYESQVFDESFFGKIDSDTKHVVNGHFQDLHVLNSAQDFSIYTNAYGLMRAKWNTNKDLYVATTTESYGFQSNEYPTCATVLEAMQGESWSEFGVGLTSKVHSKLRTMIGGSYGADYRWVKSYVASLEDAYRLVNLALPMQEYFWRSGFSVCPETCSTDTPQEDCQCYCPEFDTLAKDGTMYDTLEQRGLLDVMMQITDDSMLDELSNPPKGQRRHVMYGRREDGQSFVLTNKQQDNYLTFFAKMACTPHSLGEMSQASAPSDPTFAPSVLSMERLWQWKRLPHDDSETATAEAKKFTSSQYDFEWPEGSSFYGDSCYGHNSDDYTPWKMSMFRDGAEEIVSTDVEVEEAKDLDDSLNSISPIMPLYGESRRDWTRRNLAAAAGDKPDASGYDTTHSAVSGLESYFTNQQLYEALDPLNDNLPYMYASFNWQHCDEEGQSIQQFWKPRA